MSAKRCVCDGRYDGCEHAHPCAADVTDDRWGPWCSACNPRRFDHIDKGFAEIQAAFRDGIVDDAQISGWTPLLPASNEDGSS